ncbi:MAG: helix-turn-helix domain-containing protein [Iphinoe sp. HA4291-MV1]|nr:helix-turn-helix domain-containing protein [Iphinoe sp. HA4291-MV1]
MNSRTETRRTATFFRGQFGDNASEVMKVLKAVKVRLYPTTEQEISLAKSFGLTIDISRRILGWFETG